ncbi:LysE family translocator [Uliginosibacterium sp. 31-16]|uniref:LysE family translocator n=1 Tax=Uliginosibacterium sp. 31-16 TaxID=3068315 RepID=UPI00273F7314|nr:LysE family translocator [Uliginosibacterium sp. 31-16]MDP5238990.1 LysE family translocator [Uliginosibacterium sp. 31-16]
MHWQDFLLLAGAHFLALLSPGPDFFLLIHTALAHGRRAALRVALGIACANGVFILAAIAGLGLLSEQPLAFALLHWAGCVYLAWLGWLFWRAPPTVLEPVAGMHAALPAMRHGLRGFLSGILNPKNALFYLSLFTVLAGPASSPLARAGAGLWMFAAVLGWDCLIGWAFTRGEVRRRFERRQTLLQRGSACVMWAAVTLMNWSVLPELLRLS